MTSLDDEFGPYPGRPQHPDMKLLSDAAIHCDAQTDVWGRTIPDILSEHVDPQSLFYLARQRGLASIAALRIPKQLQNALLTMAQAQYVDAFAIAMQYIQEKEKTSE